MRYAHHWHSVMWQAQSRTRFKIEDTSLQAIRDELPNGIHEWLVDKLLQYRCVYGVEQWLVRWKGYDEDRNSWEPVENFTTDAVLREAASVRYAAVRDATSVSTFTLHTLQAVLADKGLDTSGRKQDVVQRVEAMLLAA